MNKSNVLESELQRIVNMDRILNTFAFENLKFDDYQIIRFLRIDQTRFHNLQRQALTQFIKLYQYLT